MENNFTKKINQVTQQGYYIDFGTILDKSFENYKKIALNGGLAFLLISIAGFGFFFAIAAIAFGAGDIMETMTDFNPLDFSVIGILIYFLIMVFFAGITAPIGAGFLKMAHKAQTDKPFSIGTIFDYYKTAYFKELFIAASLISIVNFAFMTGLEILGHPFIGNLITYIIAFFTLLTIPLIVFGQLTALDAISVSIKLVVKQPLILLGLAIVSIIFVCLGIIGLCIGIFFTLPFWYSFVYTTYDSILPIESVNEIDEIGKAEAYE